MKKVLFLLCMVVCFVLTDKAYAQRCLPGMRGIRVTGGMSDGFHSSDKRNELGYSFGLSLDTYTKHCNRWVFGAEYLQKYHPYKAIRIPTSQFTAEGGYYYTFLSDANKVFLLLLGGSALAGYETNNWGEKLLYDGSTLRSGDNFVYGGAVSLELESYLSNRVVVLLNARERCLWGSDTGKFHFQFGLGLKFYKYMKKMFETIFVLGLVLTGIVCVAACSDKLDVQQVYEFDMATLPVQNKIVIGEEAEIRCELVRGGTYVETKYFIRYFQPDGKGQLRLEGGTVLLPNDLYPLEKETFRLYYKSMSTDQQTIDIYVVDSFGQMIQKSFSFNNESQEDAK